MQASQSLSCELPPARGGAAAAALCASPTACERGACLAELKSWAPDALMLPALPVTPACANRSENLCQQDVRRCKQSLSRGVSQLPHLSGEPTSAASRRTATPSSLLMISSNCPAPSIKRPYDTRAPQPPGSACNAEDGLSGGPAGEELRMMEGGVQYKYKGSKPLQQGHGSTKLVE